MKRIRLLILGVGLSSALVVSVLTWRAVPAAAEPSSFPACNPVDPTDKQLVAQGRHLFGDAHVFSQQKPFRACVTCHAGQALTDNATRTVAPTGDPTVFTVPRNTPSLRQHLSQTAPYLWDGRAACLQQVAFGAITSPVEENGRVSADATGQAQLDALAAFLLSLEPPAAPRNLDAAAVARGQAVFEAKPCATCHSGPELTDNQLHNHQLGDADPGAGRVGTGAQGAFNTPTLRGLRLSAPYFHNGRNGVPEASSTQVATEARAALRQVVEFYNRQFGLELTEQQMADLVEFLLSL